MPDRKALSMCWTILWRCDAHLETMRGKCSMPDAIGISGGIPAPFPIQAVGLGHLQDHPGWWAPIVASCLHQNLHYVSYRFAVCLPVEHECRVAPFPEASTVLRACQEGLLIMLSIKSIWHAPPLSLLCCLQSFAWVVIQPHHHILDDLSISFGV